MNIFEKLYDLVKRRADIEAFLMSDNINLESGKRQAARCLNALKLVRFNNKDFYWDKDKESWVFFYTANQLIDYISSYDFLLTNETINSIRKHWSNIMSAYRINWEKPDNILFFQNGWIDLEEQKTELHLYSETDLETLSALPINFIKTDYPENGLNDFDNDTLWCIDKFMNWCGRGNSEQIDAIYKMIGICATNQKCDYFFNIYGIEGSGKTTLANIILNLVQNYTTTPVARLDERFALIPLIGKTLLYNADANEKEIDAEMLKRLSTEGETFSLEMKGKNEFEETELKLNTLIVSNHILKFSDMNGINRRLVPFAFPFKLNFKHPNFEALTDEEFAKITISKSKYKQEVLSYIMFRAVEMLKEFYKDGKRFYKTEEQLKSLSEINKDNNNFLQWAEEIELFNTATGPLQVIKNNVFRVYNNPVEWFARKNGRFCDKNKLYQNYCDWCETNGNKKKTANNFLKEMKMFFESKGLSVEASKVISINAINERRFWIEGSIIQNEGEENE